MGAAPQPLVLVVIVGPQASGKSAVSRTLAEELRRHEERVALVELDLIAGMALPTLPDWATASAIFESVTGRWTRADLTCVIAEGAGDRDEVERLRARAPTSAAVLVVALSTPFEVALARARADPSRGISRDRDFLGGVYARWPEELARIRPDLALDTGDLPLERCVERIRSGMEDARAARRGPDGSIGGDAPRRSSAVDR